MDVDFQGLHPSRRRRRDHAPARSHALRRIRTYVVRETGVLDRMRTRMRAPVSLPATVPVAVKGIEPLERAMIRYAGGDDAALGEIYDLAAPHVFRFLVRLTRQAALAEDLTHEAFLRVHGARTSYRVDAKVLPWMFAIARRLFLDSLRQGRKYGPSLDAEDRPASAEPVAGTPGPEAELVGHRLQQEVERILRSLPEQHATAYRLLKEENLSIAEAAAVLGTTETGVKLRAHRAYTALRHVLGETWLDGTESYAPTERTRKQSAPKTEIET